MHEWSCQIKYPMKTTIQQEHYISIQFHVPIYSPFKAAIQSLEEKQLKRYLNQIGDIQISDQHILYFTSESSNRQRLLRSHSNI